MSDTTTLLLALRAAPGSDDRASVIDAVIDTLLDRGDVIACSSSIPVDREGSPGSDMRLVALVVLTLPTSAAPAVVDRVALLLDPSRDWVLEVDERPIVASDRTAVAGSATPGERMVSLVTRLPTFTREEFATYWRDVHAPIAMSFTILPSTYIQYVTRRSLFGDAPEPDGVFVMHFLDARDRADRWSKHPDEAARGAADAAVFMDLARATSALMCETVRR